MIASINLTTRRYTAKLASGTRTININRPGSPVVRLIGVQGPPGAAGSSGGATIAVIAAVSLSGSRAVYIAADGLRYCDSALPATAHACVGLTVGAVAAGALSTVQVQDVLTEPSWGWVVGQSVYLALAGALTQTPPTSGAQVEIGVAKSATSILVRVQPGLTLN